MKKTLLLASCLTALAGVAHAEYLSQLPRSCMVQLEGKKYLSLLNTPECHAIARALDVKAKEPAEEEEEEVEEPEEPETPAVEEPTDETPGDTTEDEGGNDDNDEGEGHGNGHGNGGHGNGGHGHGHGNGRG